MPCLTCGEPLSARQPKFCSRSCSASFNNRGVSRNRKPTRPCEVCGEPTGSHRRLRRFCSRICTGVAKRIGSDEERIERKQVGQLARTRRYQAYKFGQSIPDDIASKIREIYRNCPDGCEVDHRIPLSRGGLHHPDNLQYLPSIENRRKSNKLTFVSTAVSASDR